MDNRSEKVIEIFKGEALAKEVLAIDNPEDAQAWFSDHGIEFTVDELKDMADKINRLSKGEKVRESSTDTDELSEDDLENVVGGAEKSTFDAIYDVIVGISKVFEGW